MINFHVIHARWKGSPLTTSARECNTLREEDFNTHPEKRNRRMSTVADLWIGLTCTLTSILYLLVPSFQELSEKKKCISKWDWRMGRILVSAQKTCCRKCKHHCWLFYHLVLPQRRFLHRKEGNTWIDLQKKQIKRRRLPSLEELLYYASSAAQQIQAWKCLLSRLAFR